jgi:hypothetical protein
VVDRNQRAASEIVSISATPIRSFEGNGAVFDIDWTIVASAVGLLISFGALFYARRPAREPIRYCPHDQEDQNADCDIIGD